MKVKFYVIEHFRFDDVGDYFLYKNALYIISYKFKNIKYCYSVFLHEFVEYFLLKAKGVSYKEIDLLDTDKAKGKRFKKVEKEYDKAHEVALGCERILAKALGLDFKKSQREILKITPKILTDLSVKKYLKLLKKHGKLIFEFTIPDIVKRL